MITLSQGYELNAFLRPQITEWYARPFAGTLGFSLFVSKPTEGKGIRGHILFEEKFWFEFPGFFQTFQKKTTILWGIPEFLEVSHQELQLHFAFPSRVSGIDGWMLSFSWNFNNFRIIYLFPRKFPYVPFVFVGSFRIFLAQWKRPLISCSWFFFFGKRQEHSLVPCICIIDNRSFSIVWMAFSL